MNGSTRRAVLATGAGAALAGAAAGPDLRRAPGVRRRPGRAGCRRHRDRALPRCAAGRHHHGRAGPAAPRRPRRRHRRPRGAARPAGPLDRGRRADDVRRRGGARRCRGWWPLEGAAGHRRGLRPRPRAPHGDHRLRREPVRRPVRPGRPQARGAARAAGLPRRRPRPGTLGRRHRHPGLLRRPAGGRARGAQPRAARLRGRRGAVEPARLRPHVVDLAVPGHAAQHVRVQGRHRQPEVRGHRRARRARLGRAVRRARRRGLDGRRVLPRGPADPDAHRDLGPHPAHGAGADRRARQEGRCAAGGLGGVRRARLRQEGHRRRARDPGHRPRAAGPPQQPRRRADPAPGLQLHRRHRRPGPPRRRAVLPRLHARRPPAVRADAARARRPTS